MKTTEENNKMIAEFMGATLKNSSVFHLLNNKNELWLPIHGICRYDTTQVGNGKILKYHTSWDWLMPIVEKIESNGYDVRIRKDDCIIYYCSDASDDVVLYVESGKGKLDSTYKAVVQFIEWYNEESKEN